MVAIKRLLYPYIYFLVSPSDFSPPAGKQDRGLCTKDHPWMETPRELHATDLKCQERLVEGVFIESFHPTIENTFSTTIKHRKQGFHPEIVNAASLLGPHRKKSNIIHYVDGCAIYR